jgi:DNA polymerase kappa
MPSVIHKIKINSQRHRSNNLSHPHYSSHLAHNTYRPDLKGKPFAVGGMSMISTADYEARKYGVRSAMPGFIARKLCPQLIFVSSNFEKYKQVAEQTRAIFADYDPDFTPASLDEAYLDITACVANVLARTHSANKPASSNSNSSSNNSNSGASQPPSVERSAAAEGCNSSSSITGVDMLGIFERATPDEIGAAAGEVTNELRERIHTRTGLTCSAGVAPTRMLAKVCSDINKPNGQFVLKPDVQEVLTFAHSLRTRQVPGIGKVTEHVLAEGLNVSTVGELWAARHTLPLLMSAKQTEFMLRACVAATDTDRKSDASSSKGGQSADRQTAYSFGHADDAGSSNSRRSISQASGNQLL